MLVPSHASSIFEAALALPIPLIVMIQFALLSKLKSGNIIAKVLLLKFPVVIVVVKVKLFQNWLVFNVARILLNYTVLQKALSKLTAF